MEFKDELKDFRKSKGLTQKELADKLGVSFSTINRLENGRFNPNYELLSKFDLLKGNLEKTSLTSIQEESDDILTDISSLIEKAKHVAYQSVNILLIQRNWMIGKRIHDEELKNTRKENYGLEIIKTLSKKLTAKYGKGFSYRSLYSFLDFFKCYPNILQTASAQSFLSWSHYLVLMQVDDQEARAWYEKEALSQSWSVRTLQRNVSTQYYYRILKSQKKDLVEQEMLDKRNDSNEDINLDFIKNPAILEFLNLPECNYVEKDLENCLIQNRKKFLMELGKGYAFVASQKRIHTEKEDYFIDLVFYNYILKCFILIDLKMGKLTHQDVGQMDMYVQMYDEMEKQENDNPTIGILLCLDTDDCVARYSSLHSNNQLFAAKYKTYLPTEQELKAEIERQRIFFQLQYEKSK